MASKKVPFKGAGFKWFPIPQHFVGTKDNPGLFFLMSSSPEMRLYMALVAESDVARSHEFERTNEHLRDFAKLDRTTLAIARNALEGLSLIRAVKTGKETYRYEILGDGGKSMSDKIAQDHAYFIPPTEVEAA
jgi:hypothetical protein